MSSAPERRRERAVSGPGRAGGISVDRAVSGTLRACGAGPGPRSDALGANLRVPGGTSPGAVA